VRPVSAVEVAAAGDVVHARVDAERVGERCRKHDERDEDDSEHVPIIAPVWSIQRQSEVIGVSISCADRLEAFEHACDGLALADAHRRDPVPRLTPVELVEERGGDPRAGGAERVAE
jgi:hypothetical protein